MCPEPPKSFVSRRLSLVIYSRDDHDRMVDQRHRSRRASNPPGRAARRGSSDCDATRTDWRDARAAEMPPKPSAPFGRARRSEFGGQPLPPAQPHRPAGRLRKGDAALISGAEDAPIFASCMASRTSFTRSELEYLILAPVVARRPRAPSAERQHRRYDRWRASCSAYD